MLNLLACFPACPSRTHSRKERPDCGWILAQATLCRSSDELGYDYIKQNSFQVMAKCHRTQTKGDDMHGACFAVCHPRFRALISAI
eukprot:scaffold305123_cov21-Prasinocladus_malaysianus.AAC.1